MRSNEQSGCIVDGTIHKFNFMWIHKQHGTPNNKIKSKVQQNSTFSVMRNTTIKTNLKPRLDYMQQNTVFNQHIEKSATQVNITSQQYFQIA
jgi:hypothetical protein